MIRETWVRVPLRAKTPVFSDECVGKKNIYYFRIFVALASVYSLSHLPFSVADPPVVISPPHFYQCNKSLLDTVDGLHPNKNLHSTHIDFEPVGDIAL